MSSESHLYRAALLESLRSAPLLVSDLPEAGCFPKEQLSISGAAIHLNFEQKLGHLYEDALAQLLAASPRYHLLEQSLQIRKDIHTTVGELDFLVRDLLQDDLIHLELATKFYLAVDTPEGLTLPGPDARDHYFKKLARLRSHQLQLPRKFQSYLPAKYQIEEIKTQQLIYGCLFDHIDAPSPAEPEFINPNCRRGKWLHQKDLIRYFENPQDLQIIPKPLWPVPLNFIENIPLLPCSVTAPLERCLMVHYPESPHPFFITPDKYPTSDSPSLA